MAKMTKEEWKQYKEDFKQDFEKSSISKFVNSGVRNPYDSYVAKWDATVVDGIKDLYYKFELKDSKRMDKSENSKGLSGLCVEIHPNAVNQELSDKDILDALEKATNCIDYDKAVNNYRKVEYESIDNGNVFAGLYCRYDDAFKTDNAKVQIHMGFGKNFPKTYRDDVLSPCEVAEAVISGYNDMRDLRWDIGRKMALENDRGEKYADDPKSEPMVNRLGRQPKGERKTQHADKSMNVDRGH